MIKILTFVVKAITWIIVNAIPFVRGLIEEWKSWQDRKKAKRGY